MATISAAPTWNSSQINMAENSFEYELYDNALVMTFKLTNVPANAGDAHHVIFSSTRNLFPVSDPPIYMPLVVTSKGAGSIITAYGEFGATPNVAGLTKVGQGCPDLHDAVGDLTEIWTIVIRCNNDNPCITITGDKHEGVSWTSGILNIGTTHFSCSDGNTTNVGITTVLSQPVKDLIEESGNVTLVHVPDVMLIGQPQFEVLVDDTAPIVVSATPASNTVDGPVNVAIVATPNTPHLIDAYAISESATAAGVEQGEWFAANVWGNEANFLYTPRRAGTLTLYTYARSKQGLLSAPISPFTLTVTAYTSQAPDDLTFDYGDPQASIATYTAEEAGTWNWWATSVTATDPNYGETFTFSLVAGTGDDDNALFRIRSFANDPEGYDDQRDQCDIYFLEVPTQAREYFFRIRATDSKGLVYEEASSFTVPADNTAPEMTAFTIPATGTSYTVDISSITATDDVAVTHYKVTETDVAPAHDAAGWVADPGPLTYDIQTQSGSGDYTLYGWAKDAANNVSATSLSDTITLTIT